MAFTRVRKYGVDLAEAVQEEKPRVKNVANEALVKTGGGRQSELRKLAAAAMWGPLSVTHIVFRHAPSALCCAL